MNFCFFYNKYIHKMGVSYFNENLFLKNIYKIYHIVDEQGQLKSDTYFRCMGLSEEEISQIHEIFASKKIPEEWKLELIREQDVHVAYSGLKIEWIFFRKKPFNFMQFAQIFYIERVCKILQKFLQALTSCNCYMICL